MATSLAGRRVNTDASVEGFANCNTHTPSNTVPITDQDGSPRVCRGFSFAVAGAIKVTTVEGKTVTIPSGALGAGIIWDIRCTHIWATGTTATDFVVYF